MPFNEKPVHALRMLHVRVKADQMEQFQSPQQEGRILQSGTHIARILAVVAAEGMFEAQVFVRLTREPEIAETYIPVGMYGSEEAAWKAAEERATRALENHEF